MASVRVGARSRLPGRRQKHPIQILSKRLLTRIGGEIIQAKFAAPGLQWKFAEARLLRGGLRKLERFLASKVAQVTRLDRFLKTRALDEVIATLEITELKVNGEESQANAVIAMTAATKSVFLSDSTRKFKGNDQIVATEFLMGQGLGNQLWSYAALRTSALRTSSDFAVVGEHNFKGLGIFEIDFGKLLDAPGFISSGGLSRICEEQTLNSIGQDVSRFDKKVAYPKSDSMLSGNFQSFEYLRDYEDFIRAEMRPSFESVHLPPDVTVLHVRMGDFVGNSVFLGREYYSKAIRWVQTHYPSNTFLIVSDQPERAARMLRLQPAELHPRPKIASSPTSTIVAPHHFGQNLAGDFNLMFSANSLILPASSLSWWAGFLSLKEKDFVLAPHRWAAHNAPGKHWSTAEIFTPGFSYVTISGTVVEGK